MSLPTDVLAVVHRRLHAQGLAGEPFPSVVDAVRAAGAVQGQEYADAKWALGRRVRDATEADVEDALARGELVRTHALRPTWHILAAEDLRWVQRATAERVHGFARPYHRRFELDAATLARSLEVLAAGLADAEPRTRAQLGELLAAAGIVAERERLGWIVMHAELEALICSGPRRGRQHTYALVEHRVGPETLPRSTEEARAELAARFFAGHGPGTIADLAWWSSLTRTQARTAVAAAGPRLAERVDDRGVSWWAAPGAHDDERRAEGALLLSVYDESVIAFKELRVVLAAPMEEGLEMRNPALVDGVCVGSWQRTLGPRAATVRLTPFVALDRAARAALEAEAARFGAFHGVPATLELAP